MSRMRRMSMMYYYSIQLILDLSTGCSGQNQLGGELHRLGDFGVHVGVGEALQVDDQGVGELVQQHLLLSLVVVVVVVVVGGKK